MENKTDPGFIGTVKLGPKGQIVIPKQVRDMFGIAPGDSLLLMAAPDKGIALQAPEVMRGLADAILGGSGKALFPQESEANLAQFAQAIRSSMQEGGE